MPPAPFGLRDFVLLVVVLAVASAARIGYLLTCAGDPRQPAPIQVQDAETAITLNRAANQPPTDRDLLVDNLREGSWFGSPAPLADLEERTAHVAPAYPWLIAWLAGWQSDPNLTTQTVRWAQAVLGVLTALLYFLFARLLFGSSIIGLLAGLLTAIHPFWIINTAEIQDGTLTSFLLAGCLFLGTAASQRGRPGASLIFGVGLAGLALVRAAMLPYTFVACLWFLVRCRTLPRGWLCALLASLGFANGLTPWLVRNFYDFGDVVPITSSMYVHLWMGNNDLARGGPEDDKALRSSLPAQRLQALRSEANQARRYGMLGEDVVVSVQADPAGTLDKRLRSAMCFLFGQTWFKQDTLSRDNGSIAMPVWLAEKGPLALRISLITMLVLGPLGWRWSYGRKREANLASLAVLWIPLPYILGHAEHFAGPRLPLDGVLLCFTAFALGWMLPPVARVVLPPANEDHD
jgi:4-amino-4-deoxy-L-arabinose transferase-like glycosyltransferase